MIVVTRFILLEQELKHLNLVNSLQLQELKEKSFFPPNSILAIEKKNTRELSPFLTVNWDILDHYLRKKIEYPDMAIIQGIEGTVEIGFLIGKDGEFQNLHIIKGIGWGCDEEALRIVSQIPKWMLAAKIDTQQNLTMSLPIHFSLN
ncbi:Gram-negative bacterial tonB protein [Cecembia lonarensis LW9]|uniref:Gram-negative bacterial tonB protein n=1 Tax=Cecembia lonarensis (strain CCUG 58316 / KCTC 22772 / LW9) TaxID=1225176 RepID=K1L289_CECL9|nr:Gram-negative bacterial tonB protein [Cecembia lonarensis LW9]